MTEKAQNSSELKNQNRQRILEHLRHAPLSRAELSRSTGLAKSSVTTLVNEMISDGLLCEAGLAQKSGNAGRTRIMLSINGDYGFAVGINLHRRYITASATDITGKIIFDFKVETKNFLNSNDAYKYIRETLRRHIEKAGENCGKLIGIGVSGPGPLDCENGIILEPPNLRLFNNFAITSALKRDFSCPVYLENDAVTLALYEHYYVHRQSGNTLFVIVSDGIGSALMQNGVVYRGSHGISGELGHISVDPFGEECPCGNKGCLERYATLSALKKRFDFDDYANLADLAESGDTAATKAVEFLINTLGTALVGAVNLFDIDKIILMGEYHYKSYILTPKLEEYIKKRSVVSRVHSVKVVHTLQKDTAASAAALPAINEFFKESADK